MSSIESLLISLLFEAALLLGASNAQYSCYNCTYTYGVTAGAPAITLGQAGCNDPFSSTGISSCNGPYCVKSKLTYTTGSGAGSYAILRYCSNGDVTGCRTENVDTIPGAPGGRSTTCACAGNNCNTASVAHDTRRALLLSAAVALLTLTARFVRS